MSDTILVDSKHEIHTAELIFLKFIDCKSPIWFTLGVFILAWTATVKQLLCRYCLYSDDWFLLPTPLQEIQPDNKTPWLHWTILSASANLCWSRVFPHAVSCCNVAIKTCQQVTHVVDDYLLVCQGLCLTPRSVAGQCPLPAGCGTLHACTNQNRICPSTAHTDHVCPVWDIKVFHMPVIPVLYEVLHIQVIDEEGISQFGITHSFVQWEP